MTNPVLRIGWWLMLVCLLAACRADRPDDVLSPSDMEAILYDYHVAEALGENSDDVQHRAEYVLSLRQSVYKKHDITQEDFEHSLEYYMRHSKEFHAIYERLLKRFEADGINADVYGELSGNAMMNSTDTVNVWHSRQAVLLSTHSQRTFSYEIKADSAFHTGDELLLSFYTLWVNESNEHDAICLLTLRYANDSVSCVTRPLGMMMRQQMKIRIEGHAPLRSIHTQILLNQKPATSPTLLLLTRFALLRQRPMLCPTPSPSNSIDSLGSSDSISPMAPSSTANASVMHRVG